MTLTETFQDSGLVSSHLPSIHPNTQPSSFAPPSDSREPADDRPGEFGRLVEIVRENDRLLAELGVLKARVAQARAHLAGPHANPLLARACVDRARTKRSGILARLRANRIEIDRISGGARSRRGAPEGAC